MLGRWRDPLAPEMLESVGEDREDLRQARLLAEDVAEHLHRALALSGDPASLNSILFGSRLLDYAGLKSPSVRETAIGGGD